MKTSQLIKELSKFTEHDLDPDVSVIIQTSIRDFQPITGLENVKIEGDRVFLQTTPIIISDTGIPQINQADLDQVLEIIGKSDVVLVQEMLDENYNETHGDPWKFMDRIGASVDEICQKSGINSPKLQYLLMLLCATRYISQMKNGRYFMEEEFIEGRNMTGIIPEVVMRSLTIIALKQPIDLVSLCNFRGIVALLHVKNLEERGLVCMEGSGSTQAVKTTDKFADMFQLSRDIDTMKSQMKGQLGERN